MTSLTMSLPNGHIMLVLCLLVAMRPRMCSADGINGYQAEMTMTIPGTVHDTVGRRCHLTYAYDGEHPTARFSVSKGVRKFHEIENKE